MLVDVITLGIVFILFVSTLVLAVFYRRGWRPGSRS